MNPSNPVFDQNLENTTPSAAALPAATDKHVGGDETGDKYEDILSDEDTEPNKLCIGHNTSSHSADNCKPSRQQAGQNSGSRVRNHEPLLMKSMEAEIGQMMRRQDQLESMLAEFTNPKPRQVVRCIEHGWGTHATHQCYKLNANLRRAPKFALPVNAGAQQPNRTRNNFNGFHDRSVNITIPRTK